MIEIKLEKRFPHIPDEDVTRIFQDGYRKGWENARKNAIPIEFLEKWFGDNYNALTDLEIAWEKENEQNKENTSQTD